MKILIFTDVASSFGGNCAATLKAIDTELKKRGFEGYFAFPSETINYKWTEGFLHKFYFDWNRDSLIKLRTYIGENKIELFHYNYVSVKRSMLLRSVLGNKPNYIFHFRNHLKYSEGFRSIFVIPLYKVLYGDRFKIAISNGVEDSLRKFSKSNIFKITNGVAVERLDYYNPENNIEKKEGIINCFIMGNHAIRKGVDIAILAVDKLISEGVNVKLYVITDNENNIINLADKLLLGKEYKSYIKCLPTRNDIAAYYHKCDVFLAISREEGLNNSIIEASYIGCRVIATKISGQNEIQLPGIKWVSSIAENQDNIKEIKDAIIAAYDESKLTNQEERDRINCIIKSKYSIESCAGKIVDTYCKVHELIK